MTLETTCADFCMTAADQWKTEGAIIPTLWAIGDRRIIFAQPKSADAWKDIPQQMAVHALLRSIVQAKTIGLISEVWVRQQEPNRPVPKNGDLESIADFDPDVRTAIIVHGWDIMSARLHSHMARLDLDTEGSPMWEFDAFDGAHGRIPEQLQMIADEPMILIASRETISAAALGNWFILEAPYRD